MHEINVNQIILLQIKVPITCWCKADIHNRSFMLTV